jgi:hypothetical protein
LAKRVQDWPLLLAGPIVRRVEPNRVAVWVALKEPRAVRLSVFDAPVDTGGGEATFDEPESLMTGTTRTVRVGDNLHFAVADAASDDPLLPGRIYAYNVSFGAPLAETFSTTEDLRSLLLLRDHRPVEPSGPGANRDEEEEEAKFVPPHLALGYESGLLPTLVMCPDEITELRIVHGSCRRPHAEVPDMLASLDDQIEAARTNALDRAHQLFLTGDQIYADDVAPALLHLCTEIGNNALGQVEQLPIRWVPPGQDEGVRPVPADSTHFPAGARKPVVRLDAELTTGDGGSHLLSLAEYCALHMLCWSNALWPKKLPTYEDLFWGQPLPLSEFDEVLEGLDLPDPIWQLHTGLFKGSKFGLKERFEDTRDLQTFTAINVGSVLKAVSQSKELKEAFGKQTEKSPGEIKKFRDGLPKVRRALANVATYMILDDHEVTDDWNLSPIWRDRVFTSDLGRTVLRNGLLGYLLCQGWGNDPAAFFEDVREGEDSPLEMSPRKRLLIDVVPRLFPTGQKAPPDRDAADEADGLLGLDGADPPVKWHYQVDGPRHRVLVLDSRTRRAFQSRTSPPTNLSPSAIREQIPDIVESPLPAGIEVLFVVSPLPLLGVPLFDELAGPLAFRAFDVKNHRAIAGMPGTNPDAAEGWSNVPAALEEVLARLAPYRRVVVLSGDVHYAHSSELSYWFRGDDTPARFAQFTSSGLKNVWPDSVIVLNRSFAFFEEAAALFSPVHRLGWLSHEPEPLRLPDRTRLAHGVRLALLTTPLLLPEVAFPEGTVVERAPDWAWRMELAADVRPQDKLPGGAKPAPLDPENPAADVTRSIEGYRRAARRHAQQLEKTTHTRRLLFASNLGVVTFRRDEDDRLAARHDLFARPGGGGAGVFTRHDVALDVPPEPIPGVRVEQPES